MLITQSSATVLYKLYVNAQNKIWNVWNKLLNVLVGKHYLLCQVQLTDVSDAATPNEFFARIRNEYGVFGRISWICADIKLLSTETTDFGWWVSQYDELSEYSIIKSCVAPPSNPGLHEIMAEWGQLTLRSVGLWGGPTNVKISWNIIYKCFLIILWTRFNFSRIFYLVILAKRSFRLIKYIAKFHIYL